MLNMTNGSTQPMVRRFFGSSCAQYTYLLSRDISLRHPRSWCTVYTAVLFVHNVVRYLNRKLHGSLEIIGSWQRGIERRFQQIANAAIVEKLAFIVIHRPTWCLQIERDLFNIQIVSRGVGIQAGAKGEVCTHVPIDNRRSTSHSGGSLTM